MFLILNLMLVTPLSSYLMYDGGMVEQRWSRWLSTTISTQKSFQWNSQFGSWSKEQSGWSTRRWRWRWRRARTKRRSSQSDEWEMEVGGTSASLSIIFWTATSTFEPCGFTAEILAHAHTGYTQRPGRVQRDARNLHVRRTRTAKQWNSPTTRSYSKLVRSNPTQEDSSSSTGAAQLPRHTRSWCMYALISLPGRWASRINN